MPCPSASKRLLTTDPCISAMQETSRCGQSLNRPCMVDFASTDEAIDDAVSNCVLVMTVLPACPAAQSANALVAAPYGSPVLSFTGLSHANRSGKRSGSRTSAWNADPRRICGVSLGHRSDSRRSAGVDRSSTLSCDAEASRQPW